MNFNLIKKGGVNEKRQIWLTTTINKERARVYTGLRIEQCYWVQRSRNEKGERALEDGNLSAVQKRENIRINNELRKILGYCRDYATAVSDSDLMTESLQYSKESFEKFMGDKIRGKEAVIRKSAEEFIKDYINRKASMVNKQTKRTLCKGTVYNHKNALQRLQQYCREKHKMIVWELFNRRFEESFIAWMNEQGFAANTIASQFSIMKVWLTDAEIEGLMTDKYFHKYPTKAQDVDNIYLTEEEIQRLYDIDFTNEEVKMQIAPQSNIEQTRDLFIIACWTGLRYGDWHDLSKSQITKDRITITTHKTMKEVTIPLHPMVKKILMKYNGKLPKSVDKTKTIKQIQKCGEIAHIDETTILNRIRGGKEILIQKPKYKCITNHTARRSFCTNMYLRKIPTKAIMALSGHTTEANFHKYIKLDSAHYADIVADSFKKTEVNTDRVAE
ncbi:MAG: site-specific integrase [Bacteroidaceae bacterium]|nr:site-specific integrase [Bacteroidaceae bacterium]